jgi:hypothetical protein
MSTQIEISESEKKNKIRAQIIECSSNFTPSLAENRQNGDKVPKPYASINRALVRVVLKSSFKFHQ